MTSKEKLEALWKKNPKDVHFYRAYCAPDAYSRMHREVYATLKRGLSSPLARIAPRAAMILALGPAVFLAYFLGFSRLWEGYFHAGGPDWKEVRNSVIWILGWTAYFLFIWLWRRAYRISVHALAASLGGDCGSHRALSVLAWLDKHWDAYAPREFSLDQSSFYLAMDIQAAHAGYPVCITTSRFNFGEIFQFYRRTSILMAAPGRRDFPSREAKEAEADLERMGWVVVDVEPGIYVYRGDTSVKTLNAITIKRVLDLMARMAAG